MDLLSNYDDETSNASNRSNTEQKSGAAVLQSEWENFEKMICPSSLPETTITCIVQEENNKQSPENTEQAPIAASLSDKKDEIDDDESHLPPGVRKKNRCHSSSSSSSDEEDKEGSHSDSDLSSSDSSDSEKESKTSKEKIQSDGKDKETKRKSTSREKSLDKRRKKKSKSRSKSPHSKRRRSSERSRRSRSRSRHRRKERKHRSHRSHSRDRRRSKDRDYRRSRRKDQKRSRSRSRDRRGRHRDVRTRVESDRGRRSRSRGEHRSRSRSRDRRRSPSPRGGTTIKYGDKIIKAGASFGRPPPSKPMTFKEKMRQQFIKAIEEGGDIATALMSKDGTVICTQTAGTQQIPAPKKPPVPLMANIVTNPAGLTAASVTASEAAMQSLIALQKETTEKTGVEIPKYYNPAAINPVKYAEQVQKRKLLWSKTKEKETNSQWHATTLSSEHDDRSKEKFRKLMGIKQDGGSGEDEEKMCEELEMKQKELFEKLDKEYQYARMATHTHRGVGLGFGSSPFPPPV